MNRFHIYGLGSALIDTEIDVTDEALANWHIDKGLLALIDANRLSMLFDAFKDNLVSSRKKTGSPTCNALIAASHFGATTYFSGRVADDADGELFLNELSSAKVQYDHQKEFDEGDTGHGLIFITPNGDRTINVHLGVNDSISPDDIDEDVLTNSDWIYIEGFLCASNNGLLTAKKGLAIAKDNDTKIALSLCDPGVVENYRDQLLELLEPTVDLIFCNQQEALRFSQTDNVNEAISNLKNYTKQLVITLGQDGALIINSEHEIIEVPSFKAEAIDTHGAGDMFAGSYLSAIAQGADTITAGTIASRASAQVTTQYGPRLKHKQHSAILSELNIRL